MYFDFFKHYLFSKHAGSLVRTISWLCLVGIGVGVMSMVVVLSVMTGFGDNMKERLLSVEPHLVFEVTDKSQIETLKGMLSKEKDLSYYLYEEQDVMLRTASGYYGGAIAKGIERGELKKMLKEVSVVNQSHQAVAFPGRMQQLNWDIGDSDVVVGVDLARSLGIFEEDDLILVAPEALLLPRGEVPPYVTMKVHSLLRSNMPDSDSKYLFYNYGSRIRRLGRTASYRRGIEVKLDEPEKYQALEEKYVKAGFRVESWATRNSALFYSLRMEKLLMTIFLGLTLLIGSFAIVTVLVLLGTQKKSDMGILMSVGLTARKTRKLIASVGMMLSGIGVVSGLVLGVCISLLLNKTSLIQLPDIYYDTTIPAKLDWNGIGVILLISGIVSLISAWLPAYLTVLSSPASALRPKR